MANNMWTDNPFTKAFGDMNLSGLPLMAPVKEMAARYIDTSEQWANQALDMSEKTTAWANETPIAPMFEAQRSLARQMLGSSTTLARQIWKIEAEVTQETSA
jgi:hypothetical protein